MSTPWQRAHERLLFEHLRDKVRTHERRPPERPLDAAAAPPSGKRIILVDGKRYEGLTRAARAMHVGIKTMYAWLDSGRAVDVSQPKPRSRR